MSLLKSGKNFLKLLFFSAKISEDEIGLEEMGRRKLFIIFLMLISFLLIIFGTSVILKKQIILGIIDYSVAVIFLVILFLLRRMVRGTVFYRLAIGLAFIILSYWLYIGAIDGTASIWIMTFPLLVFFLLGRREGPFWSGLMFIMCLVFFLDPHGILGSYRYPPQYVSRHLGTLFVVILITYNYELIRERFRIKIEQEQDNLHVEGKRLAEAKEEVDETNARLVHEIKVREKMEEELRRHRDHLEEMVEERTRELLNKNVELADVNRRLSDSQADLLASESRYRLLADNVTDLIWTTDMGMKFQYISPSITSMYGYTVEEAMPLSPGDLNTPQSLERIVRVFMAQMELENSGIADPDRYITLEVEQIRKDGTIIPVEMKASFLRDENRKAIGIIGITRDISERNKTHEILIQTEKMMTVAGLAAGMAHEINNPLSIILNSAQNLMNRLSGNRESNREHAAKLGISLDQMNTFLEARGIFRYLEGIQEAGKRASEIVKNMLSFSRRSESVPRPHNLQDLLEHSIDLASKDYDLKKKYDFRKITIKRYYSKESLMINCVGNEIEQVLINLLKNAAQAISTISAPSFQPEITVSLERRDRYASIKIADNGPGMRNEQMRRIFEPFYTTKEPGSGTGLGLSVSYFIITNNHNGSISVESEPGRGARFTILLPLDTGSS